MLEIKGTQLFHIKYEDDDEEDVDLEELLQILAAEDESAAPLESSRHDDQEPREDARRSVGSDESVLQRSGREKRPSVRLTPLPADAPRSPNTSPPIPSPPALKSVTPPPPTLLLSPAASGVGGWHGMYRELERFIATNGHDTPRCVC